MNKKIYLILTLSCLLIVGSFTSVLAETITASSNYVGNDVNWYYGPKDVAKLPGAAQTFLVPSDRSGYLASATAYFCRWGNSQIDGVEVVASLMNLTSQAYTSAPDQILETTSTPVYFGSSLTNDTANMLPITFYFSESTLLSASTYYGIFFYITDGTGLAENVGMIGIKQENTDNNHGGRLFNYDASTLGGGWTIGGAGADLVFDVRVETDAPVTPTPTPTPSPTPEAMPNWISDIIDAIIPIFTPLLVIFICGALGWRFAGAWGFFAGINLAIILLYVIAPTYMPLWAIVAVVVVDIGLLFGKVGFDRR